MYYKVVSSKSQCSSEVFQYKVGKWHDCKETENKTPFFVFTNFDAATTFLHAHVNQGYVYKCEIQGEKTFDKNLGRINDYKDNAVFADKVKLVQRICTDERIHLAVGMVFRIKNTKRYVQVNDNMDLVHLGGKNHGNYYNVAYHNDFTVDLEQRHKLTYCPKAKVTVTVTVPKRK